MCNENPCPVKEGPVCPPECAESKGEPTLREALTLIEELESLCTVTNCDECSLKYKEEEQEEHYDCNCMKEEFVYSIIDLMWSDKAITLYYQIEEKLNG